MTTQSVAPTVNLNCRMYEKQFPDIDEEVVVLVNKVIDMGVYVTLLEYNNAEGMIPLSELSRRRIRSIGKLIRVGRQEIVAVLRVDRDKGVSSVLQSLVKAAILDSSTLQAISICPRRGSRLMSALSTKRNTRSPRRYVFVEFP